MPNTQQLVAWLGLAIGVPALTAQTVDLTPGTWPTGEPARFDSLTRTWGRRVPLAEGRQGLIAATSGAAAVRAGLEALKQGGTAIDAVLTHSHADIVLMAGCCVSHAGFMSLVYYEARTGKVHTMNAGWNTVLEENDPLSIPRGTPSGRTALVPGYMAGAEAAHRRFGRLPWASLFGPAIQFAEEGILLDPVIGGMIASKKAVLARLPETKAVFTKADGEWYRAGDRFRQPALAGTLRRVATEGARHMYRGAWGRKLVAAVAADGGKMTMKDLERYRPIWSEPVRTRYHGYEIAAIGLPNVGGVNIVEALNLAELADLSQYGHPTESAEALYRLIRISRLSDIMGTSLTSRRGAPVDLLRRQAPELDPGLEARLSKDAARRTWARMQQPGWDQLNQDVFAEQAAAWATGSDHSDAVVAVDRDGNVAALLHTINTATWGSTGIVVEGVSIADPAAGQQPTIARVGPGARLPEPTNPLIVFKDGKPVLASSSIGMGVHEVTLQSVLNVLDYGMDPKAAVDTGQFLRPLVGGLAREASTEPGSQIVAEGELGPTLLDAVRALGQSIKVVPRAQAASWRGGWVGIRLDPATGRLQGGTTRLYNGWALGY